MHPNEFFDKIYCINLKRRSDRWESVQKELIKHNIHADRFEALDGKHLHFSKIHTVDHSKTKSWFPGDECINSYEASLIFNYQIILMDAIANGYEKILIFEDDVVLKENFEEMFNKTIEELPENWDIFYFGGMNWFGNDKPYSDNLKIASKTLGTYAFALKHTVFDKILKLSNLQETIDFTLAKYLREVNSYIAYPHLAGQSSGYSDIKQTENIEDPFSFEYRVASEEINIWGKYLTAESNQ